jgi:cysteinyl-tRNA synthetase
MPNQQGMKIIKHIFFAAVLIWSSCGNDEIEENIDYKQEMRTFVQNLSYYAKGFDADFIIIPQNGQELVTDNGDTDGNPVISYLNAIDGAGREDLFFGYDNDDEATPKIEKDYMLVFLDVCEEDNVEVLVTDYCFSHEKMDESYTKNNAKGYISFAAPERELNVIPDYPSVPYNVNTNDINSLADAGNFLYLLNPENFESKQDFISAISETNYDVIIMDFFFNEEEYTFSEIDTLKTKRNGGRRLVISYMSIGEAEDYRYYWQNTWHSNPPNWLAGENPDWEGNYKVRYWAKEWQNIIYGNESSYIYKIIMAGFDGIYLDIIDAFEYFE